VDDATEQVLATAGDGTGEVERERRAIHDLRHRAAFGTAGWASAPDAKSSSAASAASNGMDFKTTSPRVNDPARCQKSVGINRTGR
jgi:hypothetical protein